MRGAAAAAAVAKRRRQEEEENMTATPQDLGFRTDQTSS